MANIDSLREELYGALVECLEIIGKSHTYEETVRSYERAKKEADALLHAMDAFCLDSERYIDRKSGKIKEGTGVSLTHELRDKLTELAGYAATLELFAKDERWRDDLKHSVESVISIRAYETVEAKIIAELGLFRGRQLILEVKRSVLTMDRELGLNFFSEQAESLDGLLRTMTLFARDGALELDRPDNLDVKEVNLLNLFGEYLRYNTASKLTYQTREYIELERLEEMKALTFSYYLAESNGQGYCLTLVEDRELVKALDRERDRLEGLLGY